MAASATAGSLRRDHLESGDDPAQLGEFLERAVGEVPPSQELLGAGGRAGRGLAQIVVLLPGPVTAVGDRAGAWFATRPGIAQLFRIGATSAAVERVEIRLIRVAACCRRRR